MTEDFLHYIWKYRMIGSLHSLVGGESCRIEHPGQHNRDAGPDFFNARIVIDNTEWAGNVEIHICASDWIRHKHHMDPAYDNVILHVVYQNDRPVMQKSGIPFPTLELKEKVNATLFSVYQHLMMNRSWIPCANIFDDCGPLTWHNWIDRVAVERMDRKAKALKERLHVYQNDWNEVFYQFLCRNMGLPVNALPMDLLARSLPLRILRKHIDQREQIEALLFGQSAMLDSRSRKPYIVHLRKEYSFLSHKYALKPMAGHLWKFLRMRPANFPTIRIAQLAQLLHRRAFFSVFLECTEVTEFERLLSVRASTFWDTHYSFTSSSKNYPKNLGKQMIHLILINTVVPVLFLYGHIKKQPPVKKKALHLLEQIPAESNAVIRKWKKEGVTISSAYQSQAMIELYSRYCRRKRCLECAVGKSVLSKVR